MLWRPFFTLINFGTGSKASSEKACEELDDRNVESMLAIVISSGCATRSPVIILSRVLSEDNVTPRRVAQDGSRDFGRFGEY